MKTSRQLNALIRNMSKQKKYQFADYFTKLYAGTFAGTDISVTL
jgi:hypothetical protein